MASTRNKNTPGNYCLDQKQYTDNFAWNLYANGAHGQAYDTRLAGNGLNPGQMPWTTLSGSAVYLSVWTPADMVVSLVTFLT